MGIIDELIESRDAVKVDKGERRLSQDQALYADDLGSCLAVAAYDDFGDRVYLAHLPTYDNEDIDEQLETIGKDLDNFSHPYELFAGGTMKPGISPLDDEYDMIRSRKETEELLESRSVDHVVDWNEPPVFNRLMADPDYGILYDQTV